MNTPKRILYRELALTERCDHVYDLTDVRRKHEWMALDAGDRVCAFDGDIDDIEKVEQTVYQYRQYTIAKLEESLDWRRKIKWFLFH